MNLNVERLALPPRAQWLALRRNYVGASEVAALFGLSPWKSAFALYQEKTGAIELTAETKIMKRGRHAEKMILSWLAEDRPDWKIDAGDSVYFDREHGIGCTPDAQARDQQGRRGIVQCKAIAKPEFDKKWLSGEGGFYVPLHYQLQALTEAMLTQAEWACMAVMTMDAYANGCDVVVVPVQLHLPSWTKVLAGVADFWKRIHDRNPPPVTGALDGQVLAQLYPADDGSILDLSRDNLAVSLIQELLTLQDIKRQAAEAMKPTCARIDAIKTELKAKMGRAAFARAQDWTITCKTISKRAIPPTTYRQLTVRPARMEEAA